MAAKRGSYVPGESYSPTRGKFAGRAFPSYETYRKSLAKSAGKNSAIDLRLANAKRVAKDAPLNDEKRLASLSAIRRMRSENISLSEAAKREGIKSQDVRANLPSALRKKNGRFVATKTDSAAALMRVHTPQGTVDAVVLGSKSRSLVGRHNAAVLEVARGRSGRDLTEFRGNRVPIDGGGSLELLSDSRSARDLTRRGLIVIDGPYATASAA